jgi:hypothetical protein
MLLLVCAGRKAAEAVLPGARILAWDADAEQALRSARVPFDTVAGLLGAQGQGAIEDATIAWTKALFRRPLQDGRSFREILSWDGVPLAYFAELYLYYSTAAPGYVRAIESFERVLAALRPSEVEAAGLEAAELALLQRTCTARGILFQGPVPALSRATHWRVSIESRWNNLKTALTALKSSFGRPVRVPARGRRVLFLSHAAFWKARVDRSSGEERVYEHYFDELLPQVAADPRLDAYVLAVGPSDAFKRRGPAERLSEWMRLHPEAGPFVHVNRFTSFRVVAELGRATRRFRTFWRALLKSPAAHEAFSHHGVAFFDLSSRDLAATLLLQLPWAVRSYEETLDALRHAQPALCLLYAESSGWGRAVIAACRRSGVATLALQHGILYPRYFSYLHGPDEADCPRPDVTAVFGESARRFLVERGGYAEASLVVTGSPKFDELRALERSLDREALRRTLGIAKNERMLLLASRFRGIRETHQAVGSALPALAAAVGRIPNVRLVVKPHPAEPREPYLRVLEQAGLASARVLEPKAHLPELLVACDALCTVESLSATEALVIGRPVLVLNMPTNLSEMVAQGMALGVGAGEDPEEALRLLLDDAETQQALERARSLYLQDVAQGVDGRATERLLALVRERALL